MRLTCTARLWKCIAFRMPDDVDGLIIRFKVEYATRCKRHAFIGVEVTPRQEETIRDILSGFKDDAYFQSCLDWERRQRIYRGEENGYPIGTDAGS